MHIVRELQLYYCIVLLLVLGVTLLHFTMENFTSEETKTMLTAFKELNVKPNLDSPAEFKDWMVKYVTDLTLKSDSKDKDDSDKGASASSTATKGNTSSYIPKLSVF